MAPGLGIADDPLAYVYDWSSDEDGNSNGTINHFTNDLGQGTDSDRLGDNNAVSPPGTFPFAFQPVRARTEPTRTVHDFLSEIDEHLHNTGINRRPNQRSPRTPTDPWPFPSNSNTTGTIRMVGQATYKKNPFTRRSTIEATFSAPRHTSGTDVALSQIGGFWTIELTDQHGQNLTSLRLKKIKTEGVEGRIDRKRRISENTVSFVVRFKGKGKILNGE